MHYDIPTGFRQSLSDLMTWNDDHTYFAGVNVNAMSNEQRAYWWGGMYALICSLDANSLPSSFGRPDVVWDLQSQIFTLQERIREECDHARRVASMELKRS